MSVIADGFEIGNITLASKYCMTKTEMEALGSASGYPDVFPVWCTTDDKLYVYYKKTDGTANIASVSDITSSSTAAVWYPSIDTSTNIITWTLQPATATAPTAVTLTGAKGDSAYTTWLGLGNTGTEQDFINSLKGDFSTITDTDVATLKTKLGLDTALTEINALLTELNS